MRPIDPPKEIGKTVLLIDSAKDFAFQIGEVIKVLENKVNEIIDVVNHLQHILYNLGAQEVISGKASAKMPKKEG